MKNLVIAIAMLTTITAQAEVIKRHVYTASCKLGMPLDTYTPCSEDYGVGLDVAKCAKNEAYDQCKGDKNFDCVQVSVKVTESSSVEFPGYKVCKASARVHGYGF